MKLKKYFRCFVCITLAMLMTACSAANTPTPSSEPTTAPKVEIPKAQVVEPAGGLGLGYVYEYSAQESLVDENTVLPENIPVFYNFHPYGQGGPMFEITQADRQKMKEQLSEFLVMLRGQAPNLEEIEPDPEFTQDNVVYEEENFSIRSFLDGFSVMLPREQIPEDVTTETIQATPLLQTAVDYLGIENPDISKVDHYHPDGAVDSYEIIIANHEEDLMQTVLNRTGCYIKITHSTGSENTLVFIHHKDLSEEYQSFPTVSLEDAVAAARIEHSELPADATVTADVFYSTSINPEYFIPCYRLYFKSTETNVPQCVEMTMIDLTVFEASLTAEP